MISRQIFLILGGLFFVTACQPRVVTMEVTRMVDLGSVSEQSPQIMEVTRIVPETVEVTRIVTEDVVLEVTQSPLGTQARPVQLLFPPVADTAVINSRATVLAEALTEATGYEFVVGVVDSEETAVTLLCSAPVDTIAFLSAGGYVLAQERCGVQPGMVAQQGGAGLTWQAGMLVTGRNSGLNTLEDLAGKSWAVSDSRSLPNVLYFQALFAEAGIEPGEMVEVAGDSTAMLAVFNGEVDFATAVFVPPILPYEERLWEYDEDRPEVWRRVGIPPSRSPIGYVLVNGEPEFGGYRIRDARSRIFDVEPEIFNQTQIISLSNQIPNETLTFGHDFPLGLAHEVVDFLGKFADSETCAASLCASDFYGWTGLDPIEDAAYDGLRFTQSALGLSDESLLAIGEER